MARELPKSHHRIASLALELRFATPAQVAKALEACEEGRAKDPAEFMERERVISAAQRSQLELRLKTASSSMPRPRQDPESTLIESAEPPLSPGTKRPATASAAPSAPPQLPLVAKAPPPIEDDVEPTRAEVPGATGGGGPGIASPLAPNATLDGKAGHRSTRGNQAINRIAEREEEAGGDLLAPEAPGRYTFVRVHASGGQAKVLLCRDEHVGRDVAIKEIHPDQADADPMTSRSTSVEAQRLLREARVTGQLEHPNIVPVYDLGRRKDGALYYSMRFVRGVTLSEKLRACKTLQERLRLLRPFMDICSAVAYAHSRGVIHRDLKPSNAMVGEFGETVLLDWGIAKVRGKRDIRAVDIANEQKLMAEYAVAETVDGAAIGTPAYMSPEQAAGKVDEIDERSDVWGLGAILYQILTGSPPNTGKTQAELFTAVLAGHVRPVLDVCREAPPELAAICEKALRKEKTRRYKTAKDIADEVETYLTGGRVTAYRYSSWELLRRFAEQNKKTMAAVGLVLLAIVGALIAVTIALGRESVARAEAKRESLIAHFNLAEARVKAADQQREDFRFASAAGLAAESLLNNPAHPRGSFYSADFAQKHADARQLLVKAASTIYQTRQNSLVDLAATFKLEEALTQVAYSADGKRLAVGSYDGKVRIFDVEAKELWKTLEGHKDRVYTIAWSADGRMLASAGRDRRVILWDPQTGSQIKSLEGHENLVYQVAFSPDATLLASASWDRTLRLWDVATGETLRTLTHDDQVLAVAFSPDGKLLASGGQDRLLRVWRLPGLEPVLTLAAYAAEVRALAFSPDGRSLATGSGERSIRVFQPETGKPLQTLEVSQGVGGIWTLAYSPDGRYLVSGSFDKTVRLWDARGGSALATLEAHQGTAYGVAFSPTGDTMASAGQDRQLKLWHLRSADRHTLTGHTAGVLGVAFSPLGKLLASGGNDKVVRIFDTTTGQALTTLVGHNNAVLRLSFSKTGTLLASAARERKVIIWDLKEGRALHRLEQPQEIYDVAFSPDGNLLATAGVDKGVRLYDAARGAPHGVLEGHEAQLTSVVFSPDGKLLASGSFDKTIRIWDVAASKCIAVLKGHNDWVWSLSFSADGTRLASAGKDGVAIVWDAKSWKEQTRLVGHGQWVNSARFSPDGKLVVTGADDGTARVWDAASGEVKLILHAAREISGADFSPDGRMIALGDNNTVRLYPVDFSVLDSEPQILLEEARAAGYRPEAVR
ncbi:MAG TPA: protein kinase [Myxococcales bacterium]